MTRENGRASEYQYDILSYQKLDFFEKVKLTKKLIVDFYNKNNGKVTISFSGGLDSTVLLHIARTAIPNIKAVFSNTGLEYPEIIKFVKTIDNVDIVKPRMRFDDVINIYGYPVISKRVSRFVSDLQNPTNKNENTRNLRLTGQSRCTNPGTIQKSMKLPKKWLYLVNAPFKISDKCCDMLKKEPLNNYEKEHGTKRIIGIMADESNMRMQQARRYGTETDKLLQPMIFWKRENVLQYIRFQHLPYCKIYGNIIDKKNGGLDTTGEHRTGCMFCMFGVQHEKGENRFHRMKKTHPNQYNYCINKLGCREVLDFIQIGY
jgi:3'-phosphoadenosine 5'-phosphosulfate sulfotransferase (PAPS reductase)/FAD synthetase